MSLECAKLFNYPALTLAPAASRSTAVHPTTKIQRKAGWDGSSSGENGRQVPVC